MTAPAPRSLMSAEELLALPDSGRSELVGGALVPMTPAGGRHGILTVRIGRLLDEYVEAHQLGVCCGAETGFILRRGPDTVRAPDAAVVVRSRIPAEGVPAAYWPCAPDLAVEVVSPWDRPGEIRAKIDDYFSAGARLVWLVEPDPATVRVHRSATDVEVIGADGDLDGGDVLPGFRRPVRRLFPALRPA
ncbi:MAG: Uma2 family endonuclease [Acidobacteria bacterium]|nr:Uma2 family endonuclease [Acidobacteriota bacterium]